MKQNWQWTIVFITGFRMFLQAILLERHAYGVCWITPLLGCLIGLPFVWITARHWCDRRLVRPSGSHKPLLRLLAAVYLLIDTAQIVLLYQEGTKFASLSSYPTAVLYLLLLAFSLFVIRQHANGVYGLGAALKTALLICLGALIVFRLPDVRPIRLLPILGGGMQSLLRSALSLAGYCFSFLIWLHCAPDLSPRKGTIIGMWITACAGAAVFAACEVMISPISPGEPTGIYLAVGRLLASGRSQTSLQLILYMVWFSLMFTSVCLNLKCLAKQLSELTHRKEGWIVQILSVFSAMLLANLCEHMLGENLRAFLDVPGPYRVLLLLPLLPIPKKSGKAVVS